MAAYQMGEASFPTLAFFNLSFLLFFLRREQGRLERDGAGRPATTRPRMPTSRRSESRSRSCSPSSAGSTRPAARWPRSTRLPWTGCTTATGRRRGSSWPGRRRSSVTATSPSRCSNPTTVRASDASRSHSPRSASARPTSATAWLLHTVGDLDAADAHYRSAEELNARIGARSWLAQTRADHARLLLERDGAGDREAAARLIDARAAPPPDEIGLATVALGATIRSVSVAPATFRRDGSVVGARLRRSHGAARRTPAGCAISPTCCARPGEAGVGAGARERRRRRPRRPLGARRRSTSGRAARSVIGSASSTATRPTPKRSGDGERAALAREQRQALAEAVARDFGLGGRSRLIGDPVERARKTVSTRIRRAIATIGRVHPELGPPPRTIDRHRHLVRLPPGRAGRLADLTRRVRDIRCRAITHERRRTASAATIVEVCHVDR